MTQPLNITVLSGTNRPGAVTCKVAHRLMARYAQLEGVQAELLDLRELPVELAAPESYAKKPEGFQRFADRVLASDGIHLVAPEYNGGMPGILKLFIDHLPFPESFERRPVAFVGVAAGRFGALRPVEHLQGVFGYRNAHVFPPRVFLSGVGKALDETGEPVDAFTRGLLDDQVVGFVDFVRRLRAE